MVFKRIKNSIATRLLFIVIIVWLISTLIDLGMNHNHMNENKDFFGLLIFNIPEMQLFHRILYILIAAFISSILLLFKAHQKIKISEESLLELNTTLENKVIERTEELTKANLKLENLNQSKSNILSLIAHELKTPLNGIMGSAQLLLFELENTENKEIAELLYDSAKRLNKFSNYLQLMT